MIRRKWRKFIILGNNNEKVIKRSLLETDFFLYELSKIYKFAVKTWLILSDLLNIEKA